MATKLLKQIDIYTLYKYKYNARIMKTISIIIYD